MRAWPVLVLLANLLIAVGTSRAVRADGTPPAPRPWEQPGTQVGQEIMGPDGGKMVWVPAGAFLMGTADGGPLFANAAPVHKVRITRGFWLGKYEVTNAQWQRYLKEIGAPAGVGDYYPAWDVSWKDAGAYCRHYGLSLPTEAQWEYAAAGPETRQFPWGNDWDPQKCCNFNNRSRTGTTWPVGSFPQGASWCGALDMAGNVWQWCQDWFDPGYYAKSPPADPPGPEKGEYRVLRGGSWDLSLSDDFRCACRGYDDVPAVRIDNYGFRCVKTP
jgi:formylglycine-generating enzyme required for sulfatase activity